MQDDEIIRIVLSLPPHRDLTVIKSDWKLPEDARKTLGEPRGQKADWEITLKDGRRIHVVEFDKYYKIHWDLVSPCVNPLGHLRKDARHWYELLADFLSKLRYLFK